MTMNDGRFDSDDADTILDALMADAKTYFGSDLNDTDEAIIRTFYRPVAEQLATTQDEIGLVLDATQIDHAEGDALDLLTALIGIQRDPATKATGKVTFSRDTNATSDYTISKGTVVQTDASDPIKFETTETVTLSSGTKSVDADVEAQEGGTDGNVGANTITVMPDPPTGVEDVTNSSQTDGGTDKETDSELRDRAKTELADGSRSSAPALVSAAQAVDGVTSVSIYINDENSDNAFGNGLPAHSFELIVVGGTDADVAQAILDNKAAGDTSTSGVNGTAASASADLPNGQSKTVNFSRPTETQIYVDMDLEVTDEYDGDDDVRDSIVEYIGGVYSSGQDTTGLGAGDDVIYGEIEYAIRDVDGVYDITSLGVGTSASPTGTSNISIGDNEVATSDGTDGSIPLSTTTVSP